MLVLLQMAYNSTDDEKDIRRCTTRLKTGNSTCWFVCNWSVNMLLLLLSMSQVLFSSHHTQHDASEGNPQGWINLSAVLQTCQVSPWCNAWVALTMPKHSSEQYIVLGEAACSCLVNMDS